MPTPITARHQRRRPLLLGLVAVPILALGASAMPAGAEIDDVNIDPSETIPGDSGTLTVSGDVSAGSTFVAIAECSNETAVLGTDCNAASGTSVLVSLLGATSFEEEIEVTSTFGTRSFVPNQSPEAATVTCRDRPGGDQCAVVIVEYSGTFPNITPVDTEAVDITFDV